MSSKRISVPGWKKTEDRTRFSKRVRDVEELRIQAEKQLNKKTKTRHPTVRVLTLQEQIIWDLFVQLGVKRKTMLLVIQRWLFPHSRRMGATTLKTNFRRALASIAPNPAHCPPILSAELKTHLYQRTLERQLNDKTFNETEFGKELVKIDSELREKDGKLPRPRPISETTKQRAWHSSAEYNRNEGQTTTDTRTNARNNLRNALSFCIGKNRGMKPGGRLDPTAPNFAQEDWEIALAEHDVAEAERKKELQKEGKKYTKRQVKQKNALLAAVESAKTPIVDDNLALCFDPVILCIGGLTKGTKDRMLISVAKDPRVPDDEIEAELFRLCNPLTRSRNESDTEFLRHNKFRVKLLQATVKSGRFLKACIRLAINAVPDGEVKTMVLKEFGLVILTHDKLEKNEMLAFQTYWRKVILPYVATTKEELAEARRDYSAGTYVQMDGEGGMVKAIKDPVLKQEIVDSYIKLHFPPGSTSAFTSCNDNSRLHTSEHSSVRHGKYEELFHKTTKLLRSQIDAAFKRLEKDRLKFTADIRNVIMFAIFHVHVALKELHTPKRAIDGWERVFKDDQQFLLTECGYFTSKPNARRDKTLQHVLKKCMACIEAYSPIESTEYTHCILEKEFDTMDIPTDNLDKRFRKQEKSTKTPIGNMRSVFPTFPDYDRQLENIAAANRKEKEDAAKAAAVEKEKKAQDKAEIEEAKLLAKKYKKALDAGHGDFLSPSRAKAKEKTEKARNKLIDKVRRDSENYNPSKKEAADDCKCVTCFAWWSIWNSQEALQQVSEDEDDPNAWHSCEKCQLWWCPDCMPCGSLEKKHERFCNVKAKCKAKK